MGEGDLGGLRGHRVGDRLNAVTDANDSSLARGIEIFLAVGRDDPGAFAADGDGKRCFEAAGEESGGIEGHSKEILTERSGDSRSDRLHAANLVEDAWAEVLRASSWMRSG